MFARWTAFLDKFFYSGVKSHWDDAFFRKKLLEKLSPEMRILDAGAGAGILAETDLRESGAEIWGIDEDERVKNNPHLRRAFVGRLEEMPFEDCFFDAVFCFNVVEHLERPELFFAECSRILKPDGLLFVKTPNGKHYMPFFARLTPLSFHRFYKSKMGKKAADIFPKFYRANTFSALRKLARENNFSVVEISSMESRPEYLRIFFPAYLCGILYEKTVNFFSLDEYKIALFVVLRKNFKRMHTKQETP